MLFRSAEFSDLQGDDAAAFARLGIRAVYDMGTQAECAKHPNQLPAGTEYVVLDILKDSSQAGAAQLLTVLGDPKAAEAMLGGGKAVALFEESYRELVSLPSALNIQHCQRALRIDEAALGPDHPSTRRSRKCVEAR